MMRTVIESAKRSTTKIFGSVCAVLFALAVCFGVQAVIADKAQAAESYKYTVTLYAGNGAIDGGDEVTVGSYAYRTEIPFSIAEVAGSEPKYTVTIDTKKYTISPPNENYYVKGILKVGDVPKDKSRDSYYVTADLVEQDTQYVVAYGLKKDQTEYTVNYVDEAGKQLAPSQTFKGNIGDKPVVAYQYIEGDLLWTAEAVENIVKNCMEHTPAGGSIKITAREDVLATTIDIRDSGSGIDPVDLPHVFDRFYRGRAQDNEHAGETSGFGIGLSLAQALVSAQEGTLRVANNSEGGAHFQIAFPKLVV